MPRVSAEFSDGTRKELFSFYPDEIGFENEGGELIGLTEAEAHALRQRKDVDYLRSSARRDVLVRFAAWGFLKLPAETSTKPRGRALRIFVRPHAQDAPAGGPEGCIGVAIAGDVRFDLRAPPLTIVLRPARVARAGVPEAAVNEHREPCAHEDEIGASAEAAHRGDVDAVTQAPAAQRTTKCQFWSGVALTGDLHSVSHGSRRRGGRASIALGRHRGRVSLHAATETSTSFSKCSTRAVARASISSGVPASSKPTTSMSRKPAGIEMWSRTSSG